MIPLVSFAVDPSCIGRFDPSMLSDQNRMELFMTFDDPNAVKECLRGDPLDACTWSGITCKDDSIVKIHWISLFESVKGEINMRMIPPKVDSMWLDFEAIRGEANLTQLPVVMKALNIIDCQMTGTLLFHALPPKMEVIVIKKNDIEEISRFVNLPETLRELTISEENAELKDVKVNMLLGFVKIKAKGVRIGVPSKN